MRSPFIALAFVGLVLGSGCDSQAVNESVGTNLDDETSSADGVGDVRPGDATDLSRDGRSDAVGTNTTDSSSGSDAADEVDLTPSAPGCVVAQPKRVEWMNPHPDRGYVLSHWLTLFKTASEFEEAFGVTPPPEIAFPNEWAVFVRAEYQDLTFIEYKRLEFCPGQSEVILGTRRPEDCSFSELQVLPYSLYRIAPLPNEVLPTGGGGFGEQTVYYSCAEEGCGLGELCDPLNLCQPKMICAGVTEHLTGACTAIDHQGMVTNSVDTPIPDNEPSGAYIENEYAGVPGVIADVIVDAQFDHPRPADLVISLLSPSGTERVLWDHEADQFPLKVFQRPAWGFEGEPPNGVWTLHIVDDVVGNQGQVNGWTIAVVTLPQ